MAEGGGLEGPRGADRARIEPRELEQEMRSSYLDYAMSVIVGRALPDVRDGLKPVHRRVPLRDARPRPAAEPAVPQVRLHRRRGDGQVPPARRLGDLRHAGADGAGLLAALPAGRRPGQLRLDRRRPAGRDAVHRGAPRRAGDRDAARHRRRHRRLRPQLRRVPARAAGAAGALPQPARQRRLRDRGRDGDQHPAPQPARGRSAPSRPTSTNPDIDLEGPDGARQGPGLPGRRDDHGLGRASATPTPPAAARSGSAPRPTSSRSRAARTRSSSPSSRSWSRRAATAA